MKKNRSDILQYTRRGSNLFGSKKAQSIGSGITWMVATPIIIFLLAIFLLIALASYAKAKTGGMINDPSQAEASTFTEKLALTKKMVGFLETPLEGVKARDLIDGSPEENKKSFIDFKNSAQDFLKNNFNFQAYDNAWIRIYDLGETVGQFNSGKYKDYEAKTDYASGGNCDPTVVAENAASKLSNPPDVLYLEFPIKDKKIAVCVQYK